jgi:hypothetical protein
MAKAALVLLLIFSLSELRYVYTNETKWFKQEVFFSDWRDTGEFDFSTNAVVTWFYSGKLPIYLRQENNGLYESMLDSGDTITVGIDYYAFNMSRMFFTDTFFRQFGKDLANGKVIRLRLWKEGAEIY